MGGGDVAHGQDSTGGALANVKAVITEGNIRKTTTEQGNFQLKNLATGTYHATFTKAGFVSQSVTFYVNSGETTSVDLVMVGV